MAQPKGEIETVRAAAATHLTPFVQSSWANTSLEEVAQNNPDGVKIF